MQKLQRNAILMTAISTGSVTLMADGGEVIAEVGIERGMTPVAPFLDMLPEDGYLLPSEGVTLYLPPHAVGIVEYGQGAFDTGANPDFQPTSATRQEKEMRLMLRRMHMATTKIEARAAALDSVERIPTKVEEEPVLEEVEEEQEEIPVKKPAPKAKAEAKAD